MLANEFADRAGHAHEDQSRWHRMIGERLYRVRQGGERVVIFEPVQLIEDYQCRRFESLEPPADSFRCELFEFVDFDGEFRKDVLPDGRPAAMG